MSIRPLDAREAETAWPALEAAVEAPALTCSWTWTRTWLDHYGDAVDHRFLVGESAGRVQGIALVTEAPGRRLGPRTLHLGTAGEPVGESVFVERNRLLVHDAQRGAFAAALMDSIETATWDRLRLDGLHEQDAGALLGGRPGAIVRHEDSPVADLGGGDDVLDALTSSRRQRIRRTLRAFGELEGDWAETPAEAHGVLDELIALHQQRWEDDGQPGAFARPRFTAFHRALIDRLLPQGRAALLRVRRGDETVGCLYGLVDGERLLFYQGGLRRYEDNRLRAGVAAHVLFMRACRERGLTEYDFLAPAARYKEELSTRADRLTWAEIERPTWRMRMTRARRRVKGTAG